MGVSREEVEELLGDKEIGLVWAGSSWLLVELLSMSGANRTAYIPIPSSLTTTMFKKRERPQHQQTRTQRAISVEEDEEDRDEQEFVEEGDEKIPYVPTCP